ncbi:MAG TPA: glycosyltransferase family 2 protein [Chitinophagaceae bacterium]|nr:glycosyltransferase family 2 protein [Chitinophagaceae bacterium]HPH31342.1 glycosyltransferase family 2 protein [Chitinophagaceae bacterium]
MNAPRISIITPSFNQGDFIEETILSVLNQDYPNLEYIIIDGGSTDQTVDIIKKYSDRISYWVSEKDRGQSHAINKGFERAKGEIINWINSDDQLMPGTLHKLAALFNVDPELMMVHGRIEYFGETRPYYSVNLPAKDLDTRYISHICMPQPATFYRRQLLLEQGLLDESLHFSMDTDLFVRAGLHYKIHQSDEVFARFRLHSASKSVSAFNKNFLKDNAVIFSKTITSLGLKQAIAEMKQLDLYTAPSELYKPSSRTFDGNKMVFYFLQHRLSTLYYHKEKKEFRRIFNHLAYNHTVRLLGSGKLLIYRVLLFLPAGFLHQIKKVISRK